MTVECVVFKGKEWHKSLDVENDQLIPHVVLLVITCSIILCKTHGFKNWTGPACRIVDQWTFRFDPSQWTILWSNRHWTVQTNGWTVEPDKPFDFLQTGHSLILQIFVYYLRSPLSTRPIPRPTLTKLKLIISPS